MAGVLVLAGLMVIGGCGTESERLADMADRTVEMQSQQNSTIAKVNDDFVQLNREIQRERKELSEGSKMLEKSRRELHQERRSELAWAESFRFLAILIAAVAPLVLCGFLIWLGAKPSGVQSELTDLLVQEMIADKPRIGFRQNSGSQATPARIESLESDSQTDETA